MLKEIFNFCIKPKLEFKKKKKIIHSEHNIKEKHKIYQELMKYLPTEITIVPCEFIPDNISYWNAESAKRLIIQNEQIYKKSIDIFRGTIEPYGIDYHIINENNRNVFS